MKNLIKNTFCLIVSLSALSAPAWSAETILLCVNEPVPEGYVIIARESHTDCNGTWATTVSNNTNRITKPTDGLVVCHFSPIPAGFVRTTPTRSSDCGSYSVNPYVIVQG